MSTNRSERLPAELERVRLGLATWRERRHGGERIPDGLWRDAAQAARQYGLNRVSKSLGLDYSYLKRRAGKRAGTSGSAMSRDPVFLELDEPRAEAGLACVVELEKGNGVRMRICMREAVGVDWGKLKEAFLGA